MDETMRPFALRREALKTHLALNCSTLNSCCLLPLFYLSSVTLLCLRISKLSSQTEPLKCNALSFYLSFCQPNTHTHTHTHTLLLLCLYPNSSLSLFYFFPISLAIIFHRTLVYVVQYVAIFSICPMFLKCR